MNVIKHEYENVVLIGDNGGNKSFTPVDRKTSENDKITVNQTSIIIAKTCVGMGTLALPCAASLGGYVFSALGLTLVAMWNIYAVDRLVKCAIIIPKSVIMESFTTKNYEHNNMENVRDELQFKPKYQSTTTAVKIKKPKKLFASSSSFETKKNLLPDFDFDFDSTEPSLKPPSGASTLGKIAWFAFGDWGLNVFDFIMTFYFMGIVVSYEELLMNFISKTSFSSGSSNFDALWVFLLIASISCVPDISYLTPYSASGLIVIVFTYIVISGYGLTKIGAALDTDILQWENMWPRDFVGVASWFGIIVFSFGVVPITYNIQESMAEPEKMVQATKQGSIIVVTLYITISTVVAIIYSPEPHSFKGDVLQYLPDNWIALITYIAMSFVTIVTAPLMIIPCGDIIRGKLGISRNRVYFHDIMIRFAIVSICTLVAVTIPDFVKFISFFGSCCEALVSFLLPPLLYITLVSKGMEETANYNFPKFVDSRSMMFDKALLVFGFLITVVSSYLTFRNIFC